MIDNYMPTTSTQDEPFLFDCDNKCCGCYEDGFQYLILEDAGVTKAELKNTDIDAFNVLIKLFSTLSTKYVAFEDTKFHESVIMKPSYKGAARSFSSQRPGYKRLLRYAYKKIWCSDSIVLFSSMPHKLLLFPGSSRPV